MRNGRTITGCIAMASLMMGAPSAGASALGDGPFDLSRADVTREVLIPPKRSNASGTSPEVDVPLRAEAIAGFRTLSFPAGPDGPDSIEAIWVVGVIDTPEGELWWKTERTEAADGPERPPINVCLTNDRGDPLYTAGAAHDCEKTGFFRTESLEELGERIRSSQALLIAASKVVDQLEFTPDFRVDGDTLREVVHAAAEVSKQAPPPHPSKQSGESAGALAASSTYTSCASPTPELHCMQISVELFTGDNSLAVTTFNVDPVQVSQPTIFLYQHSAVRICKVSPIQGAYGCVETESHGRKASYAGMSLACRRLSNWVAQDTEPFVYYCGGTPATNHTASLLNYLLPYDITSKLGHNCHDESYVLMRSAIAGEPRGQVICTDPLSRDRAPNCSNWAYGSCQGCGCIHLDGLNG